MSSTPTGSRISSAGSTLSRRMMNLSISSPSVKESNIYNNSEDSNFPSVLPISPSSISSKREALSNSSASSSTKMSGDLIDAIPLIEDRLYWVCLRRAPSAYDNPQSTFVMLDDRYVYEPFCNDFGPVNLGYTIEICRHIDNLIRTTNKRIVLVTSFDGKKRGNAAYLAAAYMVISHDMTPEEACKPFNFVYPPLIPFRDASQNLSTFSLSILDCCKGLAKGISLGFLKYNSFDTEEYLKLEKVQNGDINWVVPGKFIAFSSPSSRRISSDGYVHLTPDDYIVPFKQWRVAAIVRLNRALYEKKAFTVNGINHHDLYFPDGSTPSEDIIRKFLQICEEESIIAVHCKAGLGRTGTVIALYMMKHYQFTATEAIGWLRVCRPGMVIGIQQQFLQEKQAKMWREGEDRTLVLPLSVVNSTNERLFPLQVVSLPSPSSFERSNLISSSNSSSSSSRTTSEMFKTPPKTRNQLSLDLSKKYDGTSTITSPTNQMSTPKKHLLGSLSSRSFKGGVESTPPRSENDENQNRKEFDSPITPIKVKYDRKSKDLTSPTSVGRVYTAKPMSTRGMGRILSNSKDQRAMTPPRSFFKSNHHVFDDVSQSLNFSASSNGSSSSGQHFSLPHTPQKKAHHINEFNHNFERKTRDNFLLVGSPNSSGSGRYL